MKVKFVGNKGFSLVELMVVVAIIGILSAIAVPKFQQFKSKAIRSEAVSSLTMINTLEQLYYTDNDAFTTNQASIGFALPAGARYGYAIALAGNGFTATATSASPLCPAAGTVVDVVTITDQGLIASTNAGYDAASICVP